VTVVEDPLQRIRLGQIPQVPTLLGNTEDDGSVFVLGAPKDTNLLTFLAGQIGPGSLSGIISPDLVRALYPGLSDPEVMAALSRDITFLWCVTPYI
jgi:hypothetical protein